MEHLISVLIVVVLVSFVVVEAFWYGRKIEREHAKDVYRARDGVDPYGYGKPKDNGGAEEVK